MNNFSYRNTTQIHFGKGQIAKIKDEVPADARVLITYGGGSIKKMAFLIRSLRHWMAYLSSNSVASKLTLTLKH